MSSGGVLIARQGIICERFSQDQKCLLSRDVVASQGIKESSSKVASPSKGSSAAKVLASAVDMSPAGFATLVGAPPAQRRRMRKYHEMSDDVGAMICS